MTGARCVLVVDDEPHIRGFLMMVLVDEGYSVETATDGFEALTKVREIEPDVILLDLIMPGLDGAGFLRQCRASPAHGNVPVLLMSARDEPVDANLLGAQGALVKPFDLDRLIRELECVLSQGLPFG